MARDMQQAAKLWVECEQMVAHAALRSVQQHVAEEPLVAAPSAELPTSSMACVIPAAKPPLLRPLTSDCQPRSSASLDRQPSHAVEAEPVSSSGPAPCAADCAAAASSPPVAQPEAKAQPSLPETILEPAIGLETTAESSGGAEGEAASPVADAALTATPDAAIHQVEGGETVASSRADEMAESAVKAEMEATAQSSEDAPVEEEEEDNDDTSQGGRNTAEEEEV